MLFKEKAHYFCIEPTLENMFKYYIGQKLHFQNNVFKMVVYNQMNWGITILSNFYEKWCLLNLMSLCRFCIDFNKTSILNKNWREEYLIVRTWLLKLPKVLKITTNNHKQYLKSTEELKESMRKEVDNFKIWAWMVGTVDIE